MDSENQLRAMREGLELRPEQVDASRLTPLFVPSAFFELGNWPGPYTRLHAREIGLTWSVLLPDQTMRYIDNEMAKYWETKGVDWKGLALRNLVEHSGESLGTHEFRRTNGEVYAIAMMHTDGIGPSRLLLRDQLSRLFLAGYQIALPEMSCAFAFSVEIKEPEMSKLQALIDDCYKNGMRPLAPGIYSPKDLLPEFSSAVT